MASVPTAGPEGGLGWCRGLAEGGEETGAQGHLRGCGHSCQLEHGPVTREQTVCLSGELRAVSSEGAEGSVPLPGLRDPMPLRELRDPLPLGELRDPMPLGS